MAPRTADRLNRRKAQAGWRNVKQLAQAALALATPAARGLLHFERDRCCELSKRRHTRDRRELQHGHIGRDEPHVPRRAAAADQHQPWNSCGKVILGELSYRQRLLLTAIGDAVHATARLQELTKEYGRHIQCPDSFSYFAGSNAHTATLVRGYHGIGAASAAPQYGIEAFDEGMTVDRLAKKGDGTGRLCALANSLLGKGGNEDDRHVRTAYGQLALQFQPTHSLHLHVRDQARGVMQPRRG
jgi:hypothetical protein